MALGTIVPYDIYKRFELIAAEKGLTKSGLLRLLVTAVINGEQEIRVQKVQTAPIVINIINNKQEVNVKSEKLKLLELKIKEIKTEFFTWKRDFQKYTRGKHYRESIMFLKFKQRYLELKAKGIEDPDLEKEFFAGEIRNDEMRDAEYKDAMMTP